MRHACLVLFLGLVGGLANCQAAEEKSTQETMRKLVGCLQPRGHASRLEELRQSTILIQLRQMAQSAPLEKDLVEDLLAYLRDGGYLFKPYVTDAVVSQGASGTDQLVLAQLKKALGPPRRGFVVANSAIALALAKYPSPAVTEELARMAASEPSAQLRRLYVLVLAARHDTSQDWMAQLIEFIVSGEPREQGGETQLSDYMFFVALCRVAGAVGPEPRLLDALWQGVDGRGPDEATFPVILLAALVQEPLDAEKAKEMRALERKKGLEPIEMFPLHLALARMGVDRKHEVRTALALVESDEWTVFGTVFLEDIGIVLVDAAVTAEIRSALSESSRPVRRGAIAMARRLGPDAKDMLPELRKLAQSKDNDEARAAAEACLTVGGVTQDGEWVLKEYEEGARPGGP